MTKLIQRTILTMCLAGELVWLVIYVRWISQWMFGFPSGLPELLMFSWAWLVAVLLGSLEMHGFLDKMDYERAKLAREFAR